MIIYFTSIIFLLPFSLNLHPNVAITLAPGWFEKVSEESFLYFWCMCTWNGIEAFNSLNNNQHKGIRSSFCWVTSCFIYTHPPRLILSQLGSCHACDSAHLFPSGGPWFFPGTCQAPRPRVSCCFRLSPECPPPLLICCSSPFRLWDHRRWDHRASDGNQGRFWEAPGQGWTEKSFRYRC